MTFEKLAVEQAIKKLFTERHFSISTVDSIGDMLGVNPSQHPNYKFLRGLHCVDYSAMPADLLAQLQDRVTECFTQRQFNPARMVDLVTDEGRDFAFTEDRYLGKPVTMIGRKK